MKMAFNADPDKQAIEVLFSSKTNKFDHPPSFLNGFPIVQVKETKHLGLSSIQFKFCEVYEFKDYQKNKADCRYNTMKHLNDFLPLKTLNQMNRFLFRPPLNYRDINYHVPNTVLPISEDWWISLCRQMEFIELP